MPKGSYTRRTPAELEAARAAKQAKLAAKASTVGRYSVDSLGNVIVLDDDLHAGVELKLAAALELRAFLVRVLPAERDLVEA